jgi:anti-sigma factor ChrR (cupin superfamily)
MSPRHHPRAEALANFAVGNCSPGEALLIAGHVERCAHCAGRIQALGAIGGSGGAVSHGLPRPFAPGVELTPVLGASGLGEVVFHLQLAPGSELPTRRELQVAEILLLEGGLTVGSAHYGPGDFLSLDTHPHRRLVSHAKKGCLCLVAAHDHVEEDVADGRPA